MTRIALIIFGVLVMIGGGGISAQEQPTERDMQQLMNEVREYKHEFLAKRLSLSREQREKFFEVYDKMDEQIARMNTEMRALERKIYEAPEGTITDTEYEAATNAMLELKGKEYELEKEYYPQFEDILTKRQIFLLKRAERDFLNEMLRHRQKKMRAEGQGREQRGK